MINELNLLGKRLIEAGNSEQYNAILDEMRKFSPEVLTEFQKAVLRSRAVNGGVTLDAFFAFYQLLYGFEMPRHMQKAVKKAWSAHEQGLPFVLFGARGFWKTVTFVTLDAFLIAHNPHMTGLITGANDKNCINIAKNIANVIEYNPEWKNCFAHVVPKEKAWGTEGYWVIDNRMERAEWEQQQAGIIDPTFVGGGYASSSINGKHPSLFLHADDLHDIDSWKSETERNNIKDVFLSQILKTAIRRENKYLTWVNILGVPFAKDDTLNTIAATGQCVVHRIPCMTKANENEKGAVYIDGINIANGAVYDDITGWWKLTWAEHYGIESVIADRSYGKFAFHQMYMLDIETGKSNGLKYQLYDHTKIDPQWITSGGCDFATLKDTHNTPDAGRDKFSIAYGKKTPYNQIVITDGILEQCTQAQAEEYMKASPARFANWRTGVFEGDGAGEQFYLFFIQRNPSARWTMKKTGGKAKSYRQEKEMGPWLENGTVQISDAPTPYLLALRAALDDFPNGNNDVRDGLYWLCHAFPECLILADQHADNLQTPQQLRSRNPYHLESVWSHL